MPTSSARAEVPYALPGGAVRRSLLLIGRGLRSQPRTFAIAISASVLYGLGMVAQGWVLGQITDTVVVPAIEGPGVPRSQIYLAGLALVGIGLLTAVGVAGRRVFAGMASFDVQAGHRRRVTRQYLRLPMSWHRRHPTGQLLSNANADAESAGFVFTPLPFALGVLAMLLVASVAMLAADVVLGLIGVSVLPLVLVVNAVYRRYMSPAITKVQHERARTSDVAHESFAAGAVVKALGTEAPGEARVDAVAQELRAANVAVGKIRSVFDPVIDMLPALASLGVRAVGTMRVADGLAGTGAVVTTASLLTVMTFPVRAIGFVLGDLPRSLVGHERISRVIDARGYLSEGEADLPGSGGLHLTTDQVTVTVPPAPGRPGRDLLHRVSLDVPAGRTLAVVGPTGSGKSTLVDVLARLQDPASGEVRYDGLAAPSVRTSDRTAAIALVAQNAFVFEDTIAENVTLGQTDPDTGAPYTTEQVWQALRTARAEDFVAALPHGLDTVVGERGASLSGGQRQRLAIARALIRRPRLLIMDDATSAVDPLVEQDILARLRRYAGGLTVVLIAYRTATIMLADSVLHLDSGRVVDHGPHTELLARDAGYRRLVTTYQREREARDPQEVR